MPGLPKGLARKVYVRDGWRCRFCSNRTGLHPHHVLYRSHGGKDEMCNLITLCAGCHLDGIHGAKLKLIVKETLIDNVIVQFVPKEGWKPK